MPFSNNCIILPHIVLMFTSVHWVAASWEMFRKAGFFNPHVPCYHMFSGWKLTIPMLPSFKDSKLNSQDKHIQIYRIKIFLKNRVFLSNSFCSRDGSFRSLFVESWTWTLETKPVLLLFNQLPAVKDNCTDSFDKQNHFKITLMFHLP